VKAVEAKVAAKAAEVNGAEVREAVMKSLAAMAAVAAVLVVALPAYS
jgi:transcriptional regulator NrdR family protein